MTGEPIDPVEIVMHLWAAYAAKDHAAVVRLCADDIAYAIFIPQGILPFGGGETIGKGALSDRFQMITDQFYLVGYEGTIQGVSQQTVRGQVAYCFRHKATGEVIEGVMRQVFDIADGKIARLHEFHDVERIRAFMRLVSHIAHNFSVPVALLSFQ